jgi:hypothetical protein
VYHSPDNNKPKFLTAARTGRFNMKMVEIKNATYFLVLNSIIQEKLKPIHGWGYCLIVETKLVMN